MNTLAMNDTADNGYVVNTTVKLEWDDDKPFDERPFWVTTSVNHLLMASSFHRTNNEAKQHAEQMHAAYLEAHANSDYKRQVEAV